MSFFEKISLIPFTNGIFCAIMVAHRKKYVLMRGISAVPTYICSFPPSKRPRKRAFFWRLLDFGISKNAREPLARFLSPLLPLAVSNTASEQERRFLLKIQRASALWSGEFFSKFSS